MLLFLNSLWRRLLAKKLEFRSKWGVGIGISGYRYTFERVTDIPDENEITDNVVYIIGEDGFLWLAAFKCPCGCNELIQLNLLENGEYIWRFHIRRGKVTLLPSINRKVGCMSHFHITNGRIIWWGGY